MSILFMQIDADANQGIDWDEFSTYMLLRAEGQSMMREAEEVWIHGVHFGCVLLEVPSSAQDMNFERLNWQYNVEPFV